MIACVVEEGWGVKKNRDGEREQERGEERKEGRDKRRKRELRKILTAKYKCPIIYSNWFELANTGTRSNRWCATACHTHKCDYFSCAIRSQHHLIRENVCMHRGAVWRSLNQSFLIEQVLYRVYVYLWAVVHTTNFSLSTNHYERFGRLDTMKYRWHY